MQLKSLVSGITLASALAFTTAAQADGGPGPRRAAPPPAPFSWTGFYIGANVGAAWGQDAAWSATPADATTTAFWAACTAAASCLNNRAGDTQTGVIGGIQAGYNLQFSSIVVGVEADIQGSTLNMSRGVATAVPGFFQYQGAANASVEWFGTVRARLGVLLSPTLLAYVTGGLAYGEVSRSWGAAYPLQPLQAAGRSSSTDTGWTVGGGFEWAMTNRVTVGAEYLYVDLGGGDRFAGSFVPSAGNVCNATNCNFNIRAGDLDMHIARLKVNFKF